MKKNKILVILVAVMLVLFGCKPKVSNNFTATVKEPIVYIHVNDEYDPLNNIECSDPDVEHKIETNLATNELGTYDVSVVSTKGDVVVNNKYKAIVADTKVEVVSPEISVNAGKEFNLWDNVLVYEINGEQIKNLNETKSYDVGEYDVVLSYDEKEVSYKVKVVGAECELVWVVDKEAWTEEKYVVDVPYQAEKGHYETVVVKEAVPEKGHYEDVYIVDVPYQPAVEEKGHYEQKWVVDSPAVGEKGHYETKIVHHDGVHHPAETHEETIYETWKGRQAYDIGDDGKQIFFEVEYFSPAQCNSDYLYSYFTNKYGDHFAGYRQTGDTKEVAIGTKTVVDKEAWDEPAWDEETQVWVVDTPAQEEKGHFEEEYVIDQPAKPEVKEQGHQEKKWIVDSPAIPAVTEQKYVKDTDEIAEQGHYEKIEHEEVGHYEFIEC